MLKWCCRGVRRFMRRWRRRSGGMEAACYVIGAGETFEQPRSATEFAALTEQA